ERTRGLCSRFAVRLLAGERLRPCAAVAGWFVETLRLAGMPGEGLAAELLRLEFAARSVPTLGNSFFSARRPVGRERTRFARSIELAEGRPAALLSAIVAATTLVFASIASFRLIKARLVAELAARWTPFGTILKRLTVEALAIAVKTPGLREASSRARALAVAAEGGTGFVAARLVA